MLSALIGNKKRLTAQKWESFDPAFVYRFAQKNYTKVEDFLFLRIGHNKHIHIVSKRGSTSPKVNVTRPLNHHNHA